MDTAHGVGAAADAGDERIRQPAFGRKHLLSRVSRADDSTESRAPSSGRMRSGDGADAVERAVDIGDQSRNASFMASFSVFEPDSTGRTSAPSIFMRKTLGFCRSTSTVPI